MFQIIVVQKTDTHILRSQNFLFENLSVYEECGKIYLKASNGQTDHQVVTRVGVFKLESKRAEGSESWNECQATDDKREHANCVFDT